MTGWNWLAEAPSRTRKENLCVSIDEDKLTGYRS